MMTVKMTRIETIKMMVIVIIKSQKFRLVNLKLGSPSWLRW